jgi:glycosyltransferase involved in cell wall biosynthesis
MQICILSAFEDSMQKNTGASVRIYNLSKGLAGLGNQVELILPNYVESCERIDGVAVCSYKGFFPAKFLKLISRFLGVLRPTALFFYDPLFIEKVRQVIRKSDIVQFEQQSAGLLLIPIVAKIFRKTVVIDCHDTFQALRVKNTNFMRKIFETSIEKIIYRFASVILVVSEKEKQLLCSLGISQDCIKVIPNGVDTKAFSRTQYIDKIHLQYGLTGYRIVVFVGNMEYLPNQEAVRLIALKIAPVVTKVVKNAKFLVVGRISGLTYPNLTYTGTVDNVPPILAASEVAIAPLLHGSGTRLKILEYLSCGLPVVSTALGAEGLNVQNGENAIIEDDLNVFSSKLIQLLNDEQLSTRLGRSARELVVERYDWNKIASDLNKIFLHLE